MIDPPDKDALGDPRPRNHVFREGSKAGVPQPTFAEHAHRPAYSFPGVAPFIDGEAQRTRFADHSLRSKVKGDWFVTQASNALGNACCQRREADAQASLDRAVALRETLVLATAGLDAAIIETARQLGLPEPPFAREVNRNGPRKLRRPVDLGE